MIASAIASGSSGATRHPVTPSSTRSDTPPTSVATTGVSSAIASSTTFGTPSVAEDSTNTSKRAIRAWTSSDHPGKRTRSEIPSADACSRVQISPPYSVEPGRFSPP